MKVIFLGTGAADGYPHPFCRCANCERARELGGPSLRRRASMLVNDDLLLDLGPDLITAAHALGRSLAGVRYCLQTHAHSDHLDPANFLIRDEEFGVHDLPTLHFYASGGSARRTERWFETAYGPAGLLRPHVGAQLKLEVHQVEPFQPFTAGPYRVTPVPANHDPGVEPLLYAVESQERCLFYGVDTAAFAEETWRGLRAAGLRFDVVALDHTYGPGATETDHLNATLFVEHVRRMREEGLLAEGARVFAHHIAHATNPPHPDLGAYAVQHGYEVPYDGLSVEC